MANKLTRHVVGGLSLGTVSISISLLILAILLGFGVYQKGAVLESFNGWIYSALSLMHGSCDKAVMLLTKLGDPIPAAIICLLVSLVFYVKGWRREAVALIASAAACVVIVYLLKFIFNIDRPSDKSLVALPGSPSYPSAHAACSLVVFGLIGIILSAKLRLFGFSKLGSALIAALFFALAFIIGVSRIYIGVHWATDVIGGFIVAASVLVLASNAALRP